MALSEQLAALEKAVDDAKKKESVLASADAAASKARGEYDTAVAKVQELRNGLNNTIGDLFGSQRIRVA